MLELKKYKADIETVPYGKGGKGMSVEFYATDEEQAREKLDWLVGDKFNRNWFNLEEIEENNTPY